MRFLQCICFIQLLIGFVLGDDKLSDTNRTARYNRNERPMLQLRPPGQPNVKERRYNGNNQQGPLPQTMQQISSKSGDVRFSYKPNQYPNPKPSVRVNVIGPARVILHNPTNSQNSPTVRQSHSPQQHFKKNTSHNHYSKPKNQQWSKGTTHSKPNHGPPVHRPIPFKRDEFRPSQPIAVFETPSNAPEENALAVDAYPYVNSYTSNKENPDSIGYPAMSQYIQKPDDFLKFTAADNLVDEAENTWQPSLPSPGYPKHVNSGEIKQYHSQERVSFYPDTNPEYFQPHQQESANAVKPIATTSASPILRRKPQSATMLSSRYKLKRLQDDEDVPSNQMVQSKIKPVYEFNPDDTQEQTGAYSLNQDFHSNDNTNDNIYQSVLVSSSLQTSADRSNDQPLFVTPPKPDYRDIEPTTTTTLRSITTQHSGSRVGSTRKHNRVFKRKFVRPPSLDSESCEETCLSNIVSRVYDPVCGSDSKNYDNVGRLRCTKICGDHHLHVAHFGNCEETNNTLGPTE